MQAVPVPRLLVGALLLVLAMQYSRGGEPSLRAKLNALDRRRSGAEGELERLEEEALALLDDRSSPEDRALVYATIAKMYVNSRTKVPGKIEEYSRRSLRHLQDPVARIQVLSYWADAAVILARDASTEREREALRVCLSGLDVVVANQTVDKRQPVPAVGAFTAHGEGLNALAEKHRREMSRRRSVLLQNRLVGFRKTFIVRIASIYSREADDIVELSRELQDRLGDTELRSEILEATASLLGKRLGRPVAIPDDDRAGDPRMIPAKVDEPGSERKLETKQPELDELGLEPEQEPRVDRERDQDATPRDGPHGRSWLWLALGCLMGIASLGLVAWLLLLRRAR